MGKTNKAFKSKGLIGDFGYAITVFLAVITCSCSNEKSTNQIINSDNEQLQSFKIDLKEEKTRFVDLIESVEITRLEETEESLLRSVGQIMFHEDKMVIPDNDGTIYIYSNRGDFLSKFNHKGEGPEEYISLTDLWLENGILNIHSRGKSITRYDLEGSFLSRDRLTERAGHIYPFLDGHIMDMTMAYTQDSLKYSLVTIDEEMQLDKTFLPFQTHPGFRIYLPLNSFFPLGDDLFYMPVTNNTVYKITPDEVIPFILYDFGEDWFFQPGVELNSDYYEDANRNQQAWFVINTLGPNYIYLYTTLGPRMDYSFFIDKETKQSVSIKSRTTNDDQLDIAAIGWEGDEFLFTLRSTQFKDLVDQLNEEQYSFTEGSSLEEIESSENPVLLRMKIKGFSKR
ncbi:6-bladed beta-propeller [Roseivirga misakiensis]|uniref:6-bladed beta-propeller n=1 Tax=Roseivirga misakiensis TaxID=1563681 RepID=A0A1E5T261_9BACT|nr:6-bladed beta-propeller [Roseivirga misakiensis]OEK05458.1 hypothetical protein BFP71_18925 [Roseivirga misakiensis]